LIIDLIFSVEVPDAFCINGIEIDLKELEELERRVAAKKQAQQLLSASTSCANARSANVNNDSNCESLEEDFEKSLKIHEPNAVAKIDNNDSSCNNSASLASMFLVVMSIFSILNQIYYKPTAQS
jgi:hypothetical protein